MPTLDQRILIPAPPELIWQYIGEMERHPRWRQDCERVVSLSAAQHEPGARWRYIQPEGPDFVIEITTYFARAGFEYTIVDGLPLNDAHGRFRLQEVSEGTAVHWTFEFQGRGFLGRVGRQKRAIETQMETSLRQLWQLLREIPSNAVPRPPRASVQNAPDADARANYVPRHGSKLPPNDMLAAATATPPILDDTQQLPILSADELAATFPHPNADDTPATPMLTLSHAPPPSADDTPATPIPAVTVIPTLPVARQSAGASDEELSIFDIFGIQRAVTPPPKEDTQHLIDLAAVEPVSSRADTRPREGARTRLRRRLIRNRR